MGLALVQNGVLVDVGNAVLLSKVPFENEKHGSRICCHIVGIICFDIRMKEPHTTYLRKSHSCLHGLILVIDVVVLPWFVLLKPECELKLDGCPDVCRTLLHVDGLLEATLEAVPAHGGSLFTHMAGVGQVWSLTNW